MTVPLRAALYLRVSTPRQAEHDISIPDQRRQGEAYCATRGYQLIETYVEPGSTATNSRRIDYADGGIVEMTIWRVPTPVPPTRHGLKYSLFYGRPGLREVGYDNERGKGDHRHFQGVEAPYVFSDAEQLMVDFWSDVRALRGNS
jgi:hypothetical protein